MSFGAGGLYLFDYIFEERGAMNDSLSSVLATGNVRFIRVCVWLSCRGSRVGAGGEGGTTVLARIATSGMVVARGAAA